MHSPFSVKSCQVLHTAERAPLNHHRFGGDQQQWWYLDSSWYHSSGDITRAVCPTEGPVPACLILGLCWFSGRELGCLCPPDLPLLQCSQWVVQCGERGPRSLPRPWGGAGPQPLATSQQPLSWEVWGWVLGLPPLEHVMHFSRRHFGSRDPQVSCRPRESMLRIWEHSSPPPFTSLWEDKVWSGHGWAQAGAPQVLALFWFPTSCLGQPQLSQLLTSLHLAFMTSSCCFWSHFGSQVWAASYLSCLPWQILFGQIFVGMSVTSPIGTIEALWGWGDQQWQPHCVQQGSPLPLQASQGLKKNVLEKTSLLRPCIGLIRHGVRAPDGRWCFLWRGCRLAAFPWLMWSGLTFGCPSGLTLSK